MLDQSGGNITWLVASTVLPFLLCSIPLLLLKPNKLLIRVVVVAQLGRAVAFGTIGPRFESSHEPIFI